MGISNPVDREKIMTVVKNLKGYIPFSGSK
jgi:hypothetical protein